MKLPGSERIEDLETLFEHVSEGICLHEMVYDESGQAVDYRIIDVNPAYVRITEIPKQEAVGALASELYTTGEAPFLDIFARVAYTREPASFESYWGPMKKQFKILVVSPRPGKFATVFSDITKITEARAAERESEDRLKMSQRVSRIGHYVLDFTTGLWTSSEVLDEIFGIDNTFERTFARWIRIVHSLDRKAVEKHFKSDVVAERQPFDKEYRIVRQNDGEIRWLHGLGYLETDGDGMLRTMFGTIQDITERRELEERLHQSEKMQAIGQLAGGIAHDFNNQLAGIVGYADLLREKLGDDRVLTQFADNILLATRRAADLTSQLLAFAHKGKYLSIRVDIHRVIAEVVGILQHAIDKRITVKQILGAPKPFTTGDPSQLKNVLMNLALNARDAMPDGGEIIVSTELVDLDPEFCTQSPFELVPGLYLRICVDDNGEGMDEQIIRRIFEPFFTTRPQGKGSGMGLAAVYGTIKNHGGAIDVYSEVGVGTSMKLYLPYQSVIESQPPDVTVVDSVSSSKGHILLVDDERMVLDVASLMLLNLGYTVQSCENGVEALAFYEQHWAKVDLVILDMVMPEMTGKATYLNMKAINPDIVALVSSGFSIDGEAQETLEEGANGFIQKPFRKAALAVKIAEILKCR